MQGELNFTGTLAGSISDSGGGGSSVEISPTLQSGVKIADYTIDGNNGALYAPESSGGSTVEIIPTLQSGVKVADYSIDGDSGIIYVPPNNIQSVRNPLVLLGNTLAIDLNAYYTKDELAILLPLTYQKKLEAISPIQITGGAYDQISLTFDITDYLTKSEAITNYQQKLTAGRGLSIDPSDNSIYTSFVIDAYQEKLIAGTNITIDANNVISASGGSGVNYSTTEQSTGVKWTDNSTIYQKSFEITSDTNLSTNWLTLFDVSSIGIAYLISGNISAINANDPYSFTPLFRVYRGNLQVAHPMAIRIQNGSIVTIQYTKSPT